MQHNGPQTSRSISSHAHRYHFRRTTTLVSFVVNSTTTHPINLMDTIWFLTKTQCRQNGSKKLRYDKNNCKPKPNTALVDTYCMSSGAKSKRSQMYVTRVEQNIQGETSHPELNIVSMGQPVKYFGLYYLTIALTRRMQSKSLVTASRQLLSMGLHVLVLYNGVYFSRT